jgi:hypothetical protein
MISEISLDRAVDFVQFAVENYLVEFFYHLAG